MVDIPEHKKGMGAPATSAESIEPARGEDEAKAPRDDDTIEEVMANLDLARAELAAPAEGSLEDFKTSVLGGAWLMRDKGIP